MANAYVQLQGGWVGGVKKGQKHAYVIFEWSPISLELFKKMSQLEIVTLSVPRPDEFQLIWIRSEA